MTTLSRFLLIALLVLPGVSWANQVLREDTATQIALGPFLDGTDGVTAETALTVTEWDCDLVKHADSGMAATALTITASGGSNDAAHMQSGVYSLELTATDTETAGRFTIICDHATPATFMPVRQTYMVMPTQKYDSLYGTDVLQAHVVEYTAGVITAAAIATDAIGAAEIAADAIGASEIATDAIGAAEIAADAVGAAEAGFLTDSTAFNGADIASILTDTGTTLDDLVDDLESRLGTPSDFGSGTSTIAANLQDLADNGTATFDRSTDSLQAIRDRGDAAWITGGGGACTADVGCIADGTAQSATSTTIVLASAETFANDELIGATVLINSATAGTGQARIITDYVGSTDTATVDTWTTTPTGTITYRVFGTPPGSTTSPAPVDVRQWIGTAVATPTTAGVPEVDVTFVSGTAQTANDNGADINAILVDTAEIGAAGAGLTNINLPNQTMDITGNLSGSVGSVTGAVGSVTGNVGGNVSGSVGSVTGAVGSVTGAVGSVTGNVGGIAGTITTLDALDTAQDTQHGTTQTAIDAVPTAAENATEHLSQQRVLTGTCDSGSTTTCVDNALTQANESQLDDRLICFEDSWCALITGFTPGTDTVTTTKAAPSTRASLGYTIFPATAQ